MQHTIKSAKGCTDILWLTKRGVKDEKRYHIHLMNKQNSTLTEIAKTMGRDQSTISP